MPYSSADPLFGILAAVNASEPLQVGACDHDWHICHLPTRSFEPAVSATTSEHAVGLGLHVGRDVMAGPCFALEAGAL